MTREHHPVRRMFSRPTRLALVAVAGATVGLGGCNTDSFLFDPSVLGRWEQTPTVVPILSRINSIEGPGDEQLDYTDPNEADLVPEVIEYRIGPGDVLTVTVFDLPEEGSAREYQREVDPRGIIELPQLGQVFINGMTSAGAEAAIREKMKEQIARPMATVLVAGRRAERYSVMGAVQSPGQYRIPTSHFRLLEALSTAGTFSEATDFIYIIRQVSLTDAALGRPGPAKDTPAAEPGAPSGEQLIDSINRLSKPAQTPPGGEAPAPETPKTEPKLEDLPPAPPLPAPVPKPSGSPGMFQPENPPAAAKVDLVPRAGERPQPVAAVQPESGEMAWINIDGKWVKVQKPATDPSQAPSPLGRPGPGEQLMTQRIIRVPTARLVDGDASVNIIIRPGDVIRVPTSPPGTIYMAGQISRPGAYGVAEKITLMRIIPAAGGTTSLGVAERVDLTRMVGPNRQATIRLNLRAIFEGTHPDIFLKGNDLINVGTNFWALPMAVIRNGFRMTYGFGFILDRNFAYDVYGPVPYGQ